jgi:histone H1-like protein Hc1
LIEAAEKDAEAFYTKGNNAAGTRLRGAMQNLKVTASEIRKEVTAKTVFGNKPCENRRVCFFSNCSIEVKVKQNN